MCAEAEGYFLNFAPASASLKRDSFVSSKMGNYYTPARGTMKIKPSEESNFKESTLLNDMRTIVLFIVVCFSRPLQLTTCQGLDWSLGLTFSHDGTSHFLYLSLSLSLSFFPLLLLALSSLLSVIFSKLPACRSAAWPDAAARCGRALSHTEISKSGLDIAQSLININLLSQLLSCLR